MENIPRIILFVTAGLLLGTSFLLAETQSFDVSDFKKISSGCGINVKVTQAREFSVEVTADPEIWKDLEVKKRGDTAWQQEDESSLASELRWTERWSRQFPSPG